MAKDLFEAIDVANVPDLTLIEEAVHFSNAELARNLATPDIRPALFDVTLEAWLYRIGLWGRLTLAYYNPELRRKEEVTKARFLKLLTEPNCLKAFGKWTVKVDDVNKCTLFRDFIGIDGKKYQERFSVVVDLKNKPKKAKK